MRIGATDAKPWHGVAPWQSAKLTANTLRLILGYDASPPGAIIMAQPDGIAPRGMAQIKAALTSGKGAVNLIETLSKGFGAGLAASPREDWLQKRFGAMIPEQSIALRMETGLAIMDAFGGSRQLFSRLLKKGVQVRNIRFRSLKPWSCWRK